MQATATESQVKLDESQVEQMIREIGDILAILQQQKVLTYEIPQFVSLLERPFDRIEFKHLEVHEVHRFISLVRSSSKALRYLSIHLSHDAATRLVARRDRIMGAPSLPETWKLRTRASDEHNSVVCLEIERRLDTPENMLLCLVLLSIVLYCDSFLRENGIATTRESSDDTLLSELRSIRRFANTLLSRKSLRDLLPVAVARVGELKILFRAMIDRVRTGRIHPAYAALYRLFYQWRYFIWVVSSPPEDLQRSLREYFLFDLQDPDKLYECWVFYRVLRTLAAEFDLEFKEITRGSEGVATFVSKRDPRLTVVYQRSCGTSYVGPDGREVRAVPDIVVMRNNRAVLILDAKNSECAPPQYLDQMHWYLSARECQCSMGVLIHSVAPSGTWSRYTRNGSTVIYTHLTPQHGPEMVKEEEQNERNLARTVELISERVR
jgi:hypothetical protein